MEGLELTEQVTTDLLVKARSRVQPSVGQQDRCRKLFSSSWVTLYTWHWHWSGQVSPQACLTARRGANTSNLQLAYAAGGHRSLIRSRDRSSAAVYTWFHLQRQCQATCFQKLDAFPQQILPSEHSGGYTYYISQHLKLFRGPKNSKCKVAANPPSCTRRDVTRIDTKKSKGHESCVIIVTIAVPVL